MIQMKRSPVFELIVQRISDPNDIRRVFARADDKDLAIKQIRENAGSDWRIILAQLSEEP